MAYAISYITALVVFGVLDALWLWTMAARLYRPALGDMLLTDLRLAPAIAFYLIYPAGLTFFAIMPALRAGAWSSALIGGALFGAVAYATYDLTNYATLRNWTLEITLLDIAYGAAAAALTSLAGYLAVKAMAGPLA